MRACRSLRAAPLPFAAFLLIWLPFASASIWAQNANAEQFGNIIFRPPDGWRRVEKGGALLFIPPDPPAGQRSVLIVLPGQTLSV